MKNSHDHHVLKDIKISWPWHHLPMNFGPIPSSSKRLQSNARRDDPLARMAIDQLETWLKTKKDVNDISDSAFIAKQSKIGGKYSGQSYLSSISGSSTYSHAKILIYASPRTRKMQPTEKKICDVISTEIIRAHTPSTWGMYSQP